MKRLVLLFVGAALLFLFFFFGLNLFDGRPAPSGPGAAGGTETAPPAENLEPGNLFFLVWGFAEAPDIDPLAPGYRLQVRELFRGRPQASLRRSPHGLWLARLNAAGALHWQGANLHFPQSEGEDVAEQFASRRARVAELQLRFAPLLSRYRRLLGAGELGDFTPLNWECPARSLQLATYAAKLYTAARVLEALDGRWLEAAGALLDELEGGLRLIAAGRTIKANALGRGMVELPLRALASLLNRPECPPGLERLVLERMPERPVAAFGTAAARAFQQLSFQAALRRVKRERIVDPLLLKDFFRQPVAFYALERFVAISGPRVFAVAHALAAFFLLENETAAMMRGFWDEVGRLEGIAPWELGPGKLPRLRGAPWPVRGSPLWWLRNPLGKMMARSAVPFTWPVIRNYVLRGHETKARYDLLRLLARARLAAGTDAGLSEEELRRLLDSSAPDPFSGRPFRFSRGTATLYSVGSDRADDNGRERLELWRDSDIAVPIKFIH